MGNTHGDSGSPPPTHTQPLEVTVIGSSACGPAVLLLTETAHPPHTGVTLQCAKVRLCSRPPGFHPRVGLLHPETLTPGRSWYAGWLVGKSRCHVSYHHVGL